MCEGLQIQGIHFVHTEGGHRVMQHRGWPRESAIYTESSRTKQNELERKGKAHQVEGARREKTRLLDTVSTQGVNCLWRGSGGLGLGESILPCQGVWK